MMTQRLDPAAFARTGKHEVAGSVTAADVIHHMTFRDLLHIRQICELLLDPIERRRGTMRAAFRYP